MKLKKLFNIQNHLDESQKELEDALKLYTQKELEHIQSLISYITPFISLISIEIKYKNESVNEDGLFLLFAKQCNYYLLENGTILAIKIDKRNPKGYELEYNVSLEQMTEEKGLKIIKNLKTTFDNLFSELATFQAPTQNIPQNEVKKTTSPNKVVESNEDNKLHKAPTVNENTESVQVIEEVLEDKVEDKVEIETEKESTTETEIATELIEENISNVEIQENVEEVKEVAIKNNSEEELGQITEVQEESPNNEVEKPSDFFKQDGVAEVPTHILQEDINVLPELPASIDEKPKKKKKKNKEVKGNEENKQESLVLETDKEEDKKSTVEAIETVVENKEDKIPLDNNTTSDTENDTKEDKDELSFSLSDFILPSSIVASKKSTSNDSTFILNLNDDNNLDLDLDLEGDINLEEIEDKTNTETNESNDNKELPSVDELEAVDELPSVDELEAVDELPSVDELEAVDELPSVDELEAVDELPSVDELEAVDELPSVDELEAVDELPSVDELEAVDELPSVDELEAVDDFPSIDELEAVDDFPSIDELEAVDDFPSVDELETVDELPSVDELEPVEQLPSSEELEVVEVKAEVVEVFPIIEEVKPKTTVVIDNEFNLKQNQNKNIQPTTINISNPVEAEKPKYKSTIVISDNDIDDEFSL